MCRKLIYSAALIGITTPLLVRTGLAQTGATEPTQPTSTLRISSRAVLVDVIVTDKNGNPVKGLGKDAFTVTEQDKPQDIRFFEEHTAAQQAPVAMPKMPPDVFSNFSPFPQPPAVNVLLLDSLNTRMESQSVVHERAIHFLKTAKPGSRMAIFSMGLGLHFIQGFTDDPSLLLAALNNKKNNEVQNQGLLKTPDETNAQQNVIGMMNGAEANGATAANPEMVAALQRFFTENDQSQEVDRVMVTLANLERLATFLEGFPGRKNVIWFTESPAVVLRVDPESQGEWDKTSSMLAAARVALYPVDARGVTSWGFFQAQNALNNSISSPSQIAGNTGAQVTATQGEDQERNASQSQMKIMAEQTGGREFDNSNGFAEILQKITTESSDFYTLSYTPSDTKMDGLYRSIGVRVAGGKYKLSYRPGYYALDPDLPGAAMVTRGRKVAKLAADNPGAVDPLLPFMDLGMPQSEQILYLAHVEPAPPRPGAEAEPKDKKTAQAYKVDFSVDGKDLALKPGADGQYRGTLNISLIAYDRAGGIGGRNDHVVQLNFKPAAYKAICDSGLKLHALIAMPKGQFWLRTGIYDQGSRKVGTMEIPLGSVVAPPAPAPAQSAATAPAPAPSK